MMPVPRGAKIHLCVPAAAKSQPSCASVSSWLPAVYGVEYYQHALGLAAAAIGICDHLRQPAHRQSDPAARMYPGESDDAGARADGSLEPLRHLIGRGCRGRIVERNATYARAPARCGKPHGLVMHIVVVRRRENLVVRLEHEAVVDEREALRGAVGERHFLRPPADVIRRRTLNMLRSRLLPSSPEERLESHTTLDRGERVGVKHAPVALDRRAHRARVRHDVELREMQPLRGKVELGTHRRPVGVVLRD